MSWEAVKWVLDHSASEGSTRLVAIAAAEPADPQGRDSYQTNATLARRARVGESTVRAALAWLVERGELVEDERPGPSGQRRFHFPMYEQDPGPRVARARPNHPLRKPQTPPQILRPPASLAAPANPAGHPRKSCGDSPQDLAPNHPEPSDTSPVNPSTSIEVRRVFDAWVAATERDPARTLLTRDRRLVIERALREYDVADCLAAVKNIGADAWARGANDRHTRFDDVKHALGNGEKVERWRDRTPPQDGTARSDPLAAQKAGNARALQIIDNLARGAA